MTAPLRKPATPGAVAPAPEDLGVRVYVFRGRPCVIALAVGRALTYERAGKNLIDLLRDKWSAEVERGRDLDVLDGDSLRAFKALLSDTDRQTVSSAARLAILYESGFDLVLQKTEKPEGQALRRKLADEVLPKLRRGQPVGGGAAEFRSVNGSTIGEPVAVDPSSGRVTGRVAQTDVAALLSGIVATFAGQLAAAETRRAEERAQDRAFMEKLLAAHAPAPQPEAGPGFARQVCRDLDTYAALMAPEGDAKAIKMWRGKGETELRGRLHYTGKGSAWRRFPAGKRDDAAHELEIMLDTARTVAGQRQDAAQGDLFKKH